MKQSAVFICGSSLLFREGLQSLLLHTHFVVVSSAPSLDEVLSNVSKIRPELIIYNFSDSDNILQQLQNIQTRRLELEGVRIVLLIKALTADILSEVANARIHAVLSTEITGDILRRSLELIMLDQRLFSAVPKELPPEKTVGVLISLPQPTMEQNLSNPMHPGASLTRTEGMLQHDTIQAHPPQLTALSDRERQVLRRLAEGASNKTIGRDLQITEATVKVHVKGILRKLQLKNRTQAAVWGLHNNMTVN